MALAVEVSN